MIRGPRARAANAKDFQEFLEVFHPGARAHLSATLPAEVFDAVVGSARTDWTPLALDGTYVAEIVRWLGAERARDAWRRFTSERYVKTPAIRVLRDGAVRLFGLSVKSFVRKIPLAYQQGFRDFGDMRIDVGDEAASLTIENVAAGSTTSPARSLASTSRPMRGPGASTHGSRGDRGDRSSLRLRLPRVHARRARWTMTLPWV